MNTIKEIINEKLALKNIEFRVKKHTLFLDFGTKHISLVAHSGSLNMMDKPEYSSVKAASISKYEDEKLNSVFFGMKYGDVKNELSKIDIPLKDKCAIKKWYFEENPLVAGGPIPSGNGYVNTFLSGKGYYIDLPNKFSRKDFLIHDGHLTRGCTEVASQGCITIPGMDNWNSFKKIMANTKEKGVFKIHLKVI